VEETVCEKASKKLVDECATEDPGAGEECAGVVLCNSQCLLDASCEEINGEAEGGLGACLDACLEEG
jgi:hypothetical protein